MSLTDAVVGLVGSTRLGRELGTKLVVNKYAYATPCRPRALSMAGDYTSWPGLTDRRYSGRHLSIGPDAPAPNEPDIEEVVALFKRRSFRPARDTSVLFPFFAQWFTDSFLRTKWEPDGEPRRFRENESNHEIDLCQIYGVSEVQTRMLRSFHGGRLEVQTINGQDWPAPLFDDHGALRPKYRANVQSGGDGSSTQGLYTTANFNRVTRGWTDEDKAHAFAVGLEHGNSTLGNTVMNTIFVREHNRTAAIISAAHPDWDDERIFQTARNVTIVVLLKIVIGDYIVHIAPVSFPLTVVPGMAENERWYRTNWMAVEFALLYRWHDLIPDQLEVGAIRLPAERLRRANKWLLETGLEQVLRAAARQPAGRIGLGNTADFLIKPHDQGGADVKRMSLRMARGCRLPAYNAYRKYYGLKPKRSFEALTGDKLMAGELRRLYQDIDRLEWFVGLFAEGYGDNDMMGELLVRMVANDAFTQALTNPLLAKAVYNERTFSKEGLAIIEQTAALGQVVARNTRIDDPREISFRLH